MRVFSFCSLTFVTLTETEGLTVNFTSHLFSATVTQGTLVRLTPSEADFTEHLQDK